MSGLDFLLTAAAGRLLVWLIMTNGITKAIIEKANNHLLTEFLACDLCLGFWVFLVLSIWSRSLGIVDSLTIDVIITAAVLSFFTHLVRVGFQAQYATIHYD